LDSLAYDMEVSKGSIHMDKFSNAAYLTSKDKHLELAAAHKRLDDGATKSSRTPGNRNDGGHDVVVRFLL
jgi:hypothetical protein